MDIENTIETIKGILGVLLVPIVLCFMVWCFGITVLGLSDMTFIKLITLR